MLTVFSWCHIIFFCFKQSQLLLQSWCYAKWCSILTHPKTFHHGASRVKNPPFLKISMKMSQSPDSVEVYHHGSDCKVARCCLVITEKKTKLHLINSLWLEFNWNLKLCISKEISNKISSSCFLSWSTFKLHKLIYK